MDKKTRPSGRRSLYRKSYVDVEDAEPLPPSIIYGFDSEKETHVFQDEKDLSIHPSFTGFQIPYDVQCRRRYIEKKKLYELQFQKELKLLEAQQSSAYEAARFNKHLCMTTLWPQLYNRRDQKFFINKFFRYTDKQQRRLHYLMAEKQT